MIHNIGIAARVALGGMSSWRRRICASQRRSTRQKFDMKEDA